jgi:hypothetical protein
MGKNTRLQKCSFILTPEGATARNFNFNSGHVLMDELLDCDLNLLRPSGNYMNHLL